MPPVWISLKQGGANCSHKTCKAPVKSSPPTNQHPAFYRPDALPVGQQTVSENWRRKYQFIRTFTIRNTFQNATSFFYTAEIWTQRKLAKDEVCRTIKLDNKKKNLKFHGLENNHHIMVVGLVFCKNTKYIIILYGLSCSTKCIMAW